MCIWDCEYCTLWLSSYSQLTLTHSKNEKKNYSVDLWLRKFIIFLINTKKKHQVHVSLWLRKFIILFFDILGSSTRCTKSMWVVVFFLIYEDPIDASSLGLHNHCQWQLIPPTCCVNYFAFSSYIDMESHVF